MTTMQDNKQRLRNLAARYTEINEQLERLEEEKSMIAEEFRSLGQGNHDAGDWTVQVTKNRRLDNAAFEAAFPVAQYPQFYKPTVDISAAKEEIAPVLLDKYYSEGNPRVVVK
jgi:predicted nuclease with TOPRIM domain